MSSVFFVRYSLVCLRKNIFTNNSNNQTKRDIFMSTPAILQLLPLNAPYAQERLSKHFDVIELWKEADPKAVIATRKNDIKVVEIGRASCRERVCQYV